MSFKNGAIQQQRWRDRASLSLSTSDDADEPCGILGTDLAGWEEDGRKERGRGRGRGSRLWPHSSPAQQPGMRDVEHTKGQGAPTQAHANAPQTRSGPSKHQFQASASKLRAEQTPGDQTTRPRAGSRDPAAMGPPRRSWLPAACHHDPYPLHLGPPPGLLSAVRREWAVQALLRQSGSALLL